MTQPLKTNNMKQQTAVEKAIDLINKDFEENGRLRFAYVQKVLNEAKEMERQQIIDVCEKMYSDMQEYAEFCIECDRREMPLLLVQDWYEHFKKK